jgi:hypothetical protein
MKPRVFVVMPFSVKEIKPAVSAVDGQLAQPSMEVNFDDVYNMLIAPAVERAGCRPFRADQEPGAGSILTDMYFELVTADAVLADISILNANVFYELGVRHGVSPHGVYMIHAGWSKRPFDISTERIFDYEGTLFEPSKVRDDAWQQAVSAAADKLATTLSQAFAVDEQTTASPVYNELKGLKPVDWSAVETARAKYFGGVLDQWMTKISIANQPERLGTPPHGLSEFARNNLWIINTARVEAKSDNLYALLVWDEKLTGDGPGGTSDFAEKVKQLGGRLHIINPTLL